MWMFTSKKLPENAWADTEFSVSWANKTLKAATQRTDQFVLFCDNLSAQIILKMLYLQLVIWSGMGCQTQQACGNQ